LRLRRRPSPYIHFSNQPENTDQMKSRASGTAISNTVYLIAVFISPPTKVSANCLRRDFFFVFASPVVTRLTLGVLVKFLLASLLGGKSIGSIFPFVLDKS